MNIKTELEKTIPAALPVQLNDLDLDPEKIKAIMINEVVPSDPSQDFYGSPDPDYLKTTIPLFQKAGLPAQNIQDIPVSYTQLIRQNRDIKSSFR